MDSGGSGATPDLFALLYQDLRRLAHARLQRNEPITLLDTTSLVHETFLRVLKSGRVEVSERPRFLAYASRVMRSVSWIFVRQPCRARGGNDPMFPSFRPRPSPRQKMKSCVSAKPGRTGEGRWRLVRIVGCATSAATEEDIALALGVNERTVRRD
jgi:DNA-directed RNA polymerase specialized sigma24 family protein